MVCVAIFALPSLAHAAPPANAADAPLGEFGSKLYRAFEFVDFNDLLVAIAAGRKDPWARYDEIGKPPLIDRWSRAIQESDIQKIAEIISDDTKKGGTYREHRVIGGGDLFTGRFGYYRVTLEQKKVLESNPYLTLYFKPDPSSPDGKAVLARHEYPSAGTFHRFENLLSPGLRADAQAVEAAGKLVEGSPEFQSITRRIIHELVNQVMSSSQSPLEKYQKLISIHPFSDYNGRSLRAWYRHAAGKPLFLTNWDMDLLLSYPELEALASEGDAQLARIRAGFAQAYAASAAFPKFYSRAEPWEVATDTYPDSAEGAQRIRALGEAWFRNPSHIALVQKKQGFDVDRNLKAIVRGLSLGTPSACDAVLVMGDTK